MKISEYVVALNELMRIHGDLEVQSHSFDYERQTAPLPKIAYSAILSKRERKAKFWHPLSDKENARGEKVVYV